MWLKKVILDCNYRPQHHIDADVHQYILQLGKGRLLICFGFTMRLWLGSHTGLSNLKKHAGEKRLHQNSNALSWQARRRNKYTPNLLHVMGVKLCTLASRSRLKVVLWGWKEIFLKKGEEKVCEKAPR